MCRKIGKYIYRVHINDDWYVNFADASARNSLNGDLVYRYGKRIGDQNMQLLGAWAEQSRKKSFASFLRELPGGVQLRRDPESARETAAGPRCLVSGY